MILLFSIISFQLNTSFLDGFVNSIEKFGIINGILIVMVVGIFGLLIKRAENSYKDLIEGKQKEIDRLALENKGYRETFFNIMKLNGIIVNPNEVVFSPKAGNEGKTD